MTQAITHTPTLSNSEIIKTVTGIEWREAGYSGEPIIQDIRANSAVHPRWRRMNGWVVFVIERPNRGTRYNVITLSTRTQNAWIWQTESCYSLKRIKA